ncbi:MAG: pyrroline-5-carboxylate reductase [Oscillospiraceae bacterium]|jgi:pyrroline-5-carboxylate reductase|nr:pyrroline-5-carboxylate reductase [Oscillospiraceae bacterium]MCI9551295.1 pyrroline-5-carboxylate reductase [Oscillospiraceae bacterium]
MFKQRPAIGVNFRKAGILMKKAAFIGVGNMGGALARAACRALGPEEVVLANRTPAKAEALGLELGCAAACSGGEAVRAAEYIFLGVKPQGMGALLEELSPVIRACHEAGEDKVLVSMAAGLRLDDLRGRLGEAGYGVPLLRIMPNTCAAIGRGMTALCAREGEDEAHVRGVEEILSATGRVERIPEGLMDQFSAVAGCGPAFVYPFIEALADGGVMAGLPRAQAVEYAAQMVLGAAAMVLETGKHPGALKDEVCSPGGSTIAGVAELERGGLRAAAMNAVLAAWRRSAELGK